jgi:hypothetical protein
MVSLSAAPLKRNVITKKMIKTIKSNKSLSLAIGVLIGVSLYELLWLRNNQGVATGQLNTSLYILPWLLLTICLFVFAKKDIYQRKQNKIIKIFFWVVSISVTVIWLAILYIVLI